MTFLGRNQVHTSSDQKVIQPRSTPISANSIMLMARILAWLFLKEIGLSLECISLKLLIWLGILDLRWRLNLIVSLSMTTKANRWLSIFRPIRTIIELSSLILWDLRNRKGHSIIGPPGTIPSLNPQLAIITLLTLLLESGISVLMLQWLFWLTGVRVDLLWDKDKWNSWFIEDCFKMMVEELESLSMSSMLINKDSDKLSGTTLSLERKSELFKSGWTRGFSQVGPFPSQAHSHLLTSGRHPSRSLQQSSSTCAHMKMVLIFFVSTTLTQLRRSLFL